jgi:hypothetical protein
MKRCLDSLATPATGQSGITLSKGNAQPFVCQWPLIKKESLATAGHSSGSFERAERRYGKELLILL